MDTTVWKRTVLALALIGAASMAQAQDPGDGQGGKRPDREEMKKKYDADGDGILSEAERNKMREETGGRRGGPRGPGGGKDGGRPDREEMKKKYDTDGDGTLSEAERDAMRKDRGGKGGGKGQGIKQGCCDSA